MDIAEAWEEYEGHWREEWEDDWDVYWEEAWENDLEDDWNDDWEDNEDEESHGVWGAADWKWVRKMRKRRMYDTPT